MAIDPLAIVPTICNAGLAASFRAQGDGIDVKLSHMAVGRGLPNGTGWKGYVPLRTQTALMREDVRVPLLSGSVLDGEGFRVLARIPRTADGSEVQVREVGWFLSTGELLCVWSEVADAPLTSRTPRAEIDFAHDLYLSQVPLASIDLLVEQPDIPDTTAVLAELLSVQARGFVNHVTLTLKLAALGIKV